MSDDGTFDDFLRRIRSGDAEAAAELVRRYEDTIRLEVRMRLGDPHLRRLLDSTDICQSVLASFFVRAAAGQYDLNAPVQRLKLLVAIAQNCLASVEMGQTVCSNKLQPRAEVLPCPRRPESASRSRRRSPSCGS